jgi:cytochrome c-type biogenesis protein
VDQNNANIFVAIVAGFVSFASPCVLPLVPVYLGYMSGAAVQKSGRVAAPRWRVLLHALAFVLGFTLIFVLLGASAGVVRDWIFEYRRQMEWIAGILLVVFGLQTLGVFQIPWLNYERRLGDHIQPQRNLGYFRSVFIGCGFALGWTPCVGPFLTLLYSLALQEKTAEAVPLFVAYSLGLGIPFIMAALLAGQLTLWLRKIMAMSFDLRMAGRTLLANLNPITLVSGVLLLFMGALLMLDRVTWLNTLLPQWTIGV